MSTPLFFVSLQKSTITPSKMHPFASFVTKINDYSCYRWLLRYISAFSPCFDRLEPHITPSYTPYRFRLPSKTAYYLHLGIIMHPNFDCIKIGVLIWLKTLILIQCTLWIIEGCIFVWAKSYRFRLKIGEGANWSRATYIGQLHIQSARKFAYKRTTNSRHSHPVAPNLLNRNFQISTPNTVWVGDIINSAIKYR